MSHNRINFRAGAPQAVALALCLCCYLAARLPTLDDDERAGLANTFRFTAIPLPSIETSQRRIREVHPDLERIRAWISSVGAAVALYDLDGDSLAGEICYVDTRIDQVVVASIGSTEERFAPFALAPAPLRYDASTTAPMGCLPGDFNEDGRPDLLVYYWGRTPIFFLRRSDVAVPGADAYRRQEVYPKPERWFTNAATSADVDGDGHVDLIFGNYFPDGAAILDTTGGGRRESMQRSMSRAYNGGRNRLLLWRQVDENAANSVQANSVRFEEAGFSGIEATGWTLALGAADLDGDLLPEIYFANDFGPDRLFHNRSRPGHVAMTLVEGSRTFTSPRSKVLGRDSFKGMGIDFGDLNGDGRLDFMVSNIAAEYSLEESHFAWVSLGDISDFQRGVAPYSDQSEPLGLARSGWGWEVRLADFNNDGVLEAFQATGFLKGSVDRWPELHEIAMANDALVERSGAWPSFEFGDDLSGRQRNAFFAKAPDGRYYDLAGEVGFDEPYVTRGIATADVDGDGDLDAAVANQWEDSFLFRNDQPSRRKSLILSLQLPAEEGRTRPAIGAAASVQLSDGRVLVGQVDGGNGHSGVRSPELHFGLGEEPSGNVRVDLHWRDTAGERRQRTLQLAPGRHSIRLD